MRLPASGEIGREGDGNPSALGAEDTRFDSGVPDGVDLWLSASMASSSMG